MIKKKKPKYKDNTKESERINIEIAKYFGFKECKKHKMSYFVFGGKKLPQWTYPRDWYKVQGGIPNMAIPDFLQILENALKFLHENEGFNQTEYFGGLKFDK